MADFTNSGLVAHCRKALTLKTKYMWGGLMRAITDAYIAQLFEIYGTRQYSASRRSVLKALAGKDYYGVDCVGLIKSYIFGIGSASVAGYNQYGAKYDQNVEGMYNSASVKGRINTFKKVPGQLLMLGDFSHVGVYLGGGEVAEVTLGSFGDGAVITKFSDRPWYYWAQHSLLANDTKSELAAAATPSAAKTTAIYKSLGSARIRAAASLSGAEKGKCVKGCYYPASEIVTVGKTKWFKHLNGGYSALTDTDGSALFSAAGSYTLK